jgi:hypothetical protein
MPFKQNLTSVGTSATFLCTLGGVTPDNRGVLVQNLGAQTIFIGGSNVTTSGVTHRDFSCGQRFSDGSD